MKTIFGLIIVAAASILLNAWAVMLSWNWLLVPLVGANMMTLHDAFAVSFVARIATSMHFYKVRDDSLRIMLMGGVATPVIVIIIAYIWSLFLT